MKKNTIKAFTLVEMLIVIVIIGILIASLMPRMSAAQGRARDVTRKNDLSQIQTALISYQGDHGKFPSAFQKDGKSVDTVTQFQPINDDSTPGKEIATAGGFTKVPKDPQEGARFKDSLVCSLVKAADGTCQSTTADTKKDGEYAYKLIKKGGVKDEGFLLIAHVEIPGSANYILSSNSEVASKKSSELDSKTIKLCGDIEKSANYGAAGCSLTAATDIDTTGTCKYCSDDELVYLLIY